jgi:DNA primase
MTQTRRPSTPEQVSERQAARAEKLEVLHATLVEQVAALRDGHDWKGWLRVAARFHEYSLNNVLLIAAQRPDATAVAGFTAWKALGRQVERGQKGIAILAPVIRRPAGPGGTSPDDGTGTTPGADTEPAGVDASGSPAPRGTGPRARSAGGLAGFKVVHVFDVSQTSGTPLPLQPVPALLAGEAPEGLWDALAGQVAARGFTLLRGQCGPGVNGLTHYVERTVTVRSDVDDAQAVKTLAHELGHVLLHDPTARSSVLPGEPLGSGHPAPPAAAALTSGMQCRGRIEVEAESVAYLVTAVHGLDTGSYTFPYVAGWASSVDGASRAAPEAVVRDTATRVLTAARSVLTGVERVADTPELAQSVVRAASLRPIGSAAAEGVARTGGLLADAISTEQHAQVAVTRGAGQEAAQRAVAERAGRARVPWHPSAGDHTAKATRDRLLQIHELAVAFYEARLRSGPDGRRASALLESRGVDGVAATGARLGYAPRAWTRLVEQLREAGVSDGELIASGLATVTSRDTLIDRFRDRIVFPVSDGSGGTVGLVGRRVDDTARDRYGQPLPKYLNSPESDLYRKGELLYGLGLSRPALAAGARPVLVEGPMDALAIAIATRLSSDVPAFAGVAPCGTALTSAQVAILDHATGGLTERGVVVAFDADDAGRQASVRAFDLLRQVGAWPHALHLPAGYDPARMLELHGPSAMHASLQESANQPLVDLVVDERIDRHSERLRWAEGQLAACRDAASVVVTLPPDQVARQVVRLVTRLHLPAAEVSGLIVDAVSARHRAARLVGDTTDLTGTHIDTASASTTAPRRARAGFPATVRATAPPAPARATPVAPTAAGHSHVQASAHL